MLKTHNQRLGGPWFYIDVIDEYSISRAVTGAGIRQGEATGILIIIWPTD